MLKWTLVFFAGALLGANAVYFVMTRHAEKAAAPLAIERSPTPQDASAAGAGEADPDERRRPAATAGPPAPTHPKPAMLPPGGSPPAVRPAPAAAEQPGGLVVPVQGITARELSNTFADARGADRMHDAIDIMAPRGTPVVAVADGHVEKLFDSRQGGLTLYQFDVSGRYAYYYAHLDRYAPGVREGISVRQGELIGYVGSTGNADPSAPHLHFAVFVLGPEKRWYEGTAINPYPLLGGL